LANYNREHKVIILSTSLRFSMYFCGIREIFLVHRSFLFEMAFIHVHAPTYSDRHFRSRNKCNPHLRKCYRSREQRESVAKFMARNCARSVSYNTVINHLPTMILFAASGPSVTYRDAPRTAGTIHHCDA